MAGVTKTGQLGNFFNRNSDVSVKAEMTVVLVPW